MCYPTKTSKNPVELPAHSARFLVVPCICSCGPQLTGSVSRTATGRENESGDVAFEEAISDGVRQRLRVFRCTRTSAAAVPGTASRPHDRSRSQGNGQESWNW